MKYKAIIFDMDGTIIDTEHIWKRASFVMLERRGIMLSEEQHAEIAKELHGLALTHCCLYLKMRGFFVEEVEDLAREKRQIAHELFEKEVRFMNGFLDFFKKVQQHELKTAIATNAEHETVQVTNKALNLENLFGQHVYHLEHVNRQGKPHPAIYLHASSKLEIEPEFCIAIEDSPRGIQSAKKAGMFCIGFNSAGNREALSEADIVIDMYEEVDLAQLLQRKK